MALALIIGVAFFSAVRLRPPTYSVLFANLPADDANAVINKLDAQKIPHKIVNDGTSTTVLVPDEYQASERVALAGDGVVKGGGTGYELFDRTNLGMTDSQEKIAKTRATEGELQRTIASLTPVESARVHLATPEASLYSSTQEPTTASASVKTKPGMQLSPQEVRGITLLISGAVEGLKPDHVTIVNQDGVVLVPAPGGPSGGSLADSQSDALKMTQDQLVAKHKYEEALQENVQGLLDASIGPKRSAARVVADMDFSANQVERKEYAPTGTPRSQQTERESYQGTGTVKNPATGVPGTTTNNVPTYQAQQNAQGPSKYTKTKSTVNNEISESTTKHIDAPGKLTRLSVAVLVNVPSPVTAPAPAPGQPALAAAPAVYAVAPADLVKIKNVVAAAAGIDQARGDQLSVEAIPFAPPPESLNGKGTTQTTILGIPVAALIAILVVLGLAAAGAFALAVARRNRRASSVVDLPSFDSALADELPSFEEHPMLDGTPSIAAPIRSAADLTREQMIEYVTTVAQENPDSIAKLVKLWLAE